MATNPSVERKASEYYHDYFSMPRRLTWPHSNTRNAGIKPVTLLVKGVVASEARIVSASGPPCSRDSGQKCTSTTIQDLLCLQWGLDSLLSGAGLSPGSGQKVKEYIRISSQLRALGRKEKVRRIGSPCWMLGFLFLYLSLLIDNLLSEKER